MLIVVFVLCCRLVISKIEACLSSDTVPRYYMPATDSATFSIPKADDEETGEELGYLYATLQFTHRSDSH